MNIKCLNRKRAEAAIDLNFQETSIFAYLVRAGVAVAKEEILEDVVAGRVPEKVRTFSALHDHVDANEYGGFCDEEFNAELCEFFRTDRDDPETMPEGLVELVNEVQNGVDAWLRTGVLKGYRASLNNVGVDL